MKDHRCAHPACRPGSICSDYPDDLPVTMIQISDSPKYLMHWNHQSDQRLLRDVVSTTHRLGELPIFSDQGLATIIDRYPRHQMTVTTMGENTAHPSELRYGSFDDHDGRTWIDMVRRGRLCLRLSNVAANNDEMGNIVNRLCGEMMECQPGLHSDSHEGDLWITSPYVIHYFGIDREPSVFWQIRGHRKVSHFPISEPFLSDRTLERITASGHTRPLYYEPEFQNGASVVEQVPGDVLGLPLHTPYHIATSGTLSLTLTTKYQTRQSHRRIAVLKANEKLNRWMPNQNRSTSLTGIRSFAKRMFARAISDQIPDRPDHSFHVDPSAANCIGSELTGLELAESETKSTIPIITGLVTESAAYAHTGTEN